MNKGHAAFNGRYFADECNVEEATVDSKIPEIVVGRIRLA